MSTSASSSPTGRHGGPRGAAPVFTVVDPGSFYRRLGTDAMMAFGEAYVATRPAEA